MGSNSTVACDLEKNKTHEQMSDINKETVNFQRLLQSYSNTASKNSNDRLLTSNGSNLPKSKFQLATCNPGSQPARADAFFSSYFTSQEKSIFHPELGTPVISVMSVLCQNCSQPIKLSERKMRLTYELVSTVLGAALYSHKQGKVSV